MKDLNRAVTLIVVLVVAIIVAPVLLIATVEKAHAQLFDPPRTSAAPNPDFVRVRPLGNGSFVVNHSNGQPSQYLNPVGRTGTYAVAPTDPDRLYPPQYIHIDPPRDAGEDD